jgi:hypothetical protein
MEVDIRARLRLLYVKWGKLGGTTKTFLIVVFVQFIILETLAFINLGQVVASSESDPGP